MTEAEGWKIATLLTQRSRLKNELEFAEEELKTHLKNVTETVAELDKVEDELVTLGVVL